MKVIYSIPLLFLLVTCNVDPSKISVVTVTQYDTVTLYDTVTHYDTIQFTAYDTIEFYETIYDTSMLFVTVYDTQKTYQTITDTAGVVFIERRDTIAVFKTQGVFFGSSVDSISHRDNMRYFHFEVFNYTGSPYTPTPENNYRAIFDLEVNRVIRYSDTLQIDAIQAGRSRFYTACFPVLWFASKPLPENWTYSDLDLDYHYRLRMITPEGKLKDAWYPKPINPAMPVKQYMEVYKDTVMYWVRPIIVDTPVVTKRPVYQYQDSLIYVDDIIGCRIFSHMYFGGNRVYSVVVDTCTKRLYSDLTDSKTGGISSLIVKAWSPYDTAKIDLYVNDTLGDFVGNYSKSDSLLVYIIPRPIAGIKSIRFESRHNWTIAMAKLNNVDLFTMGITMSGDVTKVVDKYVFTPVYSTPSSLIANWKFNGNGNDVTGKYNLTIPVATMLRNNTNAEGTGNIVFQGDPQFLRVGILPLGSQFTVTGWFMNNNPSTTPSRPLISNGSNFSYPDGFTIFLDETNKALRLTTGDGTAANRISTSSSYAIWPLSVWTSFAITVDKTARTCKIYINGTLNITNSNGVFPTFKSNTPVLIGGAYNNATWVSAYTYMDDIRIYDKILSASDITTVFRKQDLPGGAAGVTNGSLKIVLP